MKWADEILKPTAALAYNGEGEFNAGDHCRFCKAKATCRKRAEHNLELAQCDFEMSPNLDGAEIAAILPRINDLVAWANDIKEYALQQALRGVEYPGFITKPQGKPTLVPESDKRPALNTAKDDFSEE